MKSWVLFIRGHGYQKYCLTECCPGRSPGLTETFLLSSVWQTEFPLGHLSITDFLFHDCNTVCYGRPAASLLCCTMKASWQSLKKKWSKASNWDSLQHLEGDSSFSSSDWRNAPLLPDTGNRTELGDNSVSHLCDVQNANNFFGDPKWCEHETKWALHCGSGSTPAPQLLHWPGFI